ncbi:MAG: DUF3887 domain-containing protein [Anaerolineales bacterium]
MKTRFFPLVSMLVFALLGTACQAKPAALSDAEVVALTEAMLAALDQGDYAAFSRDFSPTMLAAFPQEQFDSLRAMLREASGGPVSCAQPALSNRQGYAVYRLTCAFEKEDVVVTIVFAVDGRQVEGLFFDSPNLRALAR